MPPSQNGNAEQLRNFIVDQPPTCDPHTTRAACHSIRQSLYLPALNLVRPSEDHVPSYPYLLEPHPWSATNMGNLCSKSSNKPDNFAGQGRVVGASPQPTSSSAPIPQKISTANSSGRPLGGTAGDTTSDARSAAAKAAEVRTYYRRCSASIAAASPGPC
jgi:hypothetical protein